MSGSGDDEPSSPVGPGENGPKEVAAASSESRAASSLTDAVARALAASVPPAAMTEGSPVEEKAATEEKAADEEKVEPKSEAAAPSDEASPNHGEVAANGAEPPTGPESGEPSSTQPASALDGQSAAAAPDGMVIRYFGRTDVGLVREHNEDNFMVADLTVQKRGTDGAIATTTLGARGLVLSVCDGMGGAAAGEVASQMAVDTIYEILQGEATNRNDVPRDRDQFARRLVRSIEEAGARIFSAAKMDRTRRGMGTTATVAGLLDSILFVGQVGDSRAYVLRGDQFALITKDQSLVNQLIEAGQLTEEEAEAFEHSNIILQALGTTEEVTVDLTFLELRRGDRLLICSDGLSGLVHADMMKEVLRTTPDLTDAAQQLIAMANSGGGHDNITVIVAEFDGATLRQPDNDARVAYQQYPLPPADPSEAEAGPARSTSIKAGPPKPGADVKRRGNDSGREDSIPQPPAASRMWLVGLVLLVVLIGVAALIVLGDTGEQGRNDVDGDTRVTDLTTVRSASADPMPRASVRDGRVVVHTDAEHGVLFLNGERYAGSTGDGMELTLPAGAYHLEMREGDVRVAEATVTLEPGGQAEIALRMPSGAIPEPTDSESQVDPAGIAVGTPQLEAPAESVARPRRPIESTAGPRQAAPSPPSPSSDEAPAEPGQVL